MSEEQNSLPVLASSSVAEPALRPAPAKKPRRKAAPAASVAVAVPLEALVAAPPPAPEAAAAPPPAKPRAKRAPRKTKDKLGALTPALEQTADLFATLPMAFAAEAPDELPAPDPLAPGDRLPAPAAESPPLALENAPSAVPAPADAAAPAPLDAADSLSAPAVELPLPAESAATVPAEAVSNAPAEGESAPLPAESTPETTLDMPPAAPRRKRKRRRGKGERAAPGEAVETTGQGELSEAPAGEALIALEAPLKALLDAFEGPAEDSAEAADALSELVVAAPPAPLPPLTIVSLGLEHPPVLAESALAALRAARVVLGTADALDRLAGLGLNLPQQLCAADSAHLAVRSAGDAGSVLVVVGDAAGDGPAVELLAELGPARVRVLPGVGRVQAACAALGLSAEIVSLVDLRRASLAALRGRLRAHRLLAVPLADGVSPVTVARLLLDSGFAAARVWVCEFPGGRPTAVAWLASELAELRSPVDSHAVLIIATGPSAGLFAELPGLSAAALGDEAGVALPLAVRTLVLAWLQPAAWENGWAIADGDASLALEWARAVPTARVRAVGVEPSLVGVAMARAGVGENLAALASAVPAHCADWPVPAAVFVRGGPQLAEWLAAAWQRLAPGGRLVASAEDDEARAELLAFAAYEPAAAWQELSLSSGETVAGRLRFVPGVPVRLALWRKPGLS